ncbi:MAG: hypothetical protein K6A65_02470 [Succinivibrionaceae bacterium]|nr:hypothetical protein [Succinivibrionaceae bacterium]
MTDKVSTEELKNELEPVVKELAQEILISGGVAALTELVKYGLKKLLVTNYERSDLSGTETARVNHSDNAANQNKNGAAKTDGSLAHNEVSGQEGEVKANETEAAAADQKAKAANADAEALKTRAGAANISTTALGIN